MNSPDVLLPVLFFYCFVIIPTTPKYSQTEYSGGTQLCCLQQQQQQQLVPMQNAGREWFTVLPYVVLQRYRWGASGRLAGASIYTHRQDDPNTKSGLGSRQGRNSRKNVFRAVATTRFAGIVCSGFDHAEVPGTRFSHEGMKQDGMSAFQLRFYQVVFFLTELLRPDSGKTIFCAWFTIRCICVNAKT